MSQLVTIAEAIASSRSRTQGLCDPQQNIRALTMTGGNVQAAIELIFSGSEWSPFQNRDRRVSRMNVADHFPSAQVFLPVRSS